MTCTFNSNFIYNALSIVTFHLLRLNGIILTYCSDRIGIIKKLRRILFSVHSRNPLKRTYVFQSNLDRFLISGWMFSVPACMILNKVLIYSTCFACFYTAFCTRILCDSKSLHSFTLVSEFLYRSLVICCAT